nr:agamous-like MADS-box protein AGL1 [Ipomoea trifida]
MSGSEVTRSQMENFCKEQNAIMKRVSQISTLCAANVVMICFSICSQMSWDFGSERAEAKRPVWDAAIDVIAAGSWEVVAFSNAAAAGAEGVNLEASELPPGVIQHHRHLLRLPRL